MPAQPPVLGDIPLRVPRVPGARNLLYTDLTADDILSISTANPESSQTTLEQLALYLEEAGFAGSVENVEDLAALEGAHLHGTIIVRGYAANADGGGGIYHYNSASTADPIQGAIVRPDSVDAGDPGRWFLLYDKEINLAQVGAPPNGSTYVDATSAFEAAFALAATFGSGDIGALTLTVPSGRYKVGPILTDVQGINIIGVTPFTARITALNAAQPYLFYFNNTSPAIVISYLEFTGWLQTDEPASFPDYCIIADDGTNNFNNLRINRTHTCLLQRNGNRCRFWKLELSLFDVAGLALGGVNDANNALTAQTWASGVVTFTTTAAHGLIPGAPFTISNSTPSGYNGDYVATSGTTTGSGGTTITAVLASNPGASTVLGRVNAATGVSETRIYESTANSGADDIGVGNFSGAQIRYLTGCAATVVENVDGGTTIIGHEIVDNLALGNTRAPGFVTLRGCTTGVVRDAGVWIKNNGASFAADFCNFSAGGDPPSEVSGDGVRVDSPNAAPRFYNCDWHGCIRNGIRATDFYSISVLGGTFRDIGDRTGDNGIGVHLVSGSGKFFAYGTIFDPNLQVDGSADMNYAVRLATAFTGVAYVAGCKAVDIVVAKWSNASTTGILNTYDNSDLVVVPGSARAEDINQLIVDYRNIMFLDPVSPSDKIVVPAGRTLISLISGEPVVSGTNIAAGGTIFAVGGSLIVSGTYNTGTGEVALVMAVPSTLSVGDTTDFSLLTGTGAYASLEDRNWTVTDVDGTSLTVTGTTGLGAATITGGYVTAGEENSVHGPTFQGEWWIDGDDRADLRTGFHVVPGTFKLQYDTLFLTNLGTGMKGTRGNIRGVFIDRLFMYDIRDYGIRFYSDRRSLEIDTICIGPMLSNTKDSGAECVWFDIGPRVGSGGKNGFNIGEGIAYRGKNTLHTWGVIELTAQSWSAGSGGRVTFTTEYKHGLVAGDVFYIDGSVPTGYNNLTTGYTALAGTEGTTLIAALASDPGASTTLGYYTVSSDVTYSGDIIFNAPRKLRVDKLSSRGTVDDGFNLQAGADFEFNSVTIDDPGTSNFNIDLTAQTFDCLHSALTAQSWLAGVVTFTTTDSHGLAAGDAFTTSGSTPSGYNGNWVALTAAGTTLTAALATDPGASSVLGTATGILGTLTAQSWAAGVLTYTTTAPHTLSPGDSFEITNSLPAGYNGVFTAAAGTTGSTLKAALVSDPGASTSLGYLRGKNTFTTDTVHGLNVGDYYVIQGSSPDGYNGTYQAVTVPSTTQVTGYRTFNPGASTTLGNMDVPLNVNAAGYHFGPKFHGSYRIIGGILHETYGHGVKDEAIYGMPSTIAGLLVWNASWGSPGVNSGLYFATGCSNRTLLSITSGTGDHWRHASRDITFAVGNVSDGNTLVLNGTTITFRNVVTLPFEVLIGGTAAITVANLAAFIVASNNVNMLAVTPSISTSGTSTVLTLVHYPGATGNLYTLSKVGANITLGAPRLGGGTGTPVQKYGIEGLADGLRGNRIINANLWNNITGEQSATNQPLPPSQGGTGVANNDASTITISGAFGITWTVAATTSLTLPPTGTLATLAGAEAFTNKTSYNKTAITAPATLSTLAIADGMTLSFEYGTWVPVATFATPGDLAVVYTTQTGSYVKIGPWVFWNLNLVFTPTYTTSAGAFQITGEPFTPVNTTASAVNSNANLTWPAGSTSIVGLIAGSAAITLRGIGSASASQTITVTGMPTTLQQSITVSGAFRIA